MPGTECLIGWSAGCAQVAVELYEECKALPMPQFLKDQLQRATSSIVLNLAEGSAKPTEKDRKKFYRIALGSLREVQAILALEAKDKKSAHEKADKAGAYIYKLTRA